MHLVSEAGIFGLVTVALFSFGLVAVVKGRRSPSTPSMLILASGVLGHGVAQRLVSSTAINAGSWELLAVGSGEASANLVLAGIAAVVLLGVSALQRLSAR